MAKVISAAEAAALIGDGMTGAVDGFIGFSLAEDILCEMEERFLREGHPRDLRLVNVAGLGGDGRRLENMIYLLLGIGGKALLRRARIEAEKRLVVGSTVLDAEERSAYVGGKEITLTVREFDLLYKLLSYPRRTFSRAQLMDEFWDGETSARLRAVDVYITKIRDKFSACPDFEIVTVHGLGYKAVPGT